MFSTYPHLHFHTLALDGAYMPGKTPNATPRIVAAPEPTIQQVRARSNDCRANRRATRPSAVTHQPNR